MGVTFSEPLEKLCLGVFVVFVMAAAVTSCVQRLGAAGAKRKPAARRKKKSPSRSPEPQAAPPVAAAATAAAAGACADVRTDGRIVVDGVDLADIVDVDVEPRTHEDWRPVAVRGRHRRKAA